ncbi:MAG: aldehyde dehydrogenase family protein [Magnetovibrio sp.]|nr:aldehyde dehydrogenase family protein [Magnetovibrio sp.]
MQYETLFRDLGITANHLNTGDLIVHTPIDGSVLAKVTQTPVQDMNVIVQRAHHAFDQWQKVPSPRRGELIRIFGEKLRRNKDSLGQLVSLETGKILQEGLGEVQEMIDICDFAVGISRQLYGLTIASERPGHRMQETWHPLGVVGVISAFNFPVAVWSWNAALALVCGNSLIWKPSEKSPLTALACQNILQSAIDEMDDAPDNLLHVIIGGTELGTALVEHPNIPLISATGSTAMGRQVGPKVAERFGRTILELGGNNAMIVTPSANLELAKRAAVFSAVGTAGQRCTSLRRMFIHESIYDQLVSSLIRAYENVPVGNPLEDETLMGPLIDQAAFENMQASLEIAERGEGKNIHGGERVFSDVYPDAYYVRPAIVEMDEQSEVMRRETFAPILYVMKYKNLEDAITLQNDVTQGLSSCIFSTDVRETELFLSSRGSDCGIANVNIGPSGAEIGGAFGGEKETGGGREAGSDAWRGYMRRATNTINYSDELPLAQGIKFDIS